MSAAKTSKTAIALITIDEVYPVFQLTTNMKVGPVQIVTTKDKVEEWKKVFGAYKKVQVEIEKLVNYYEPVAVKSRKQSTE